MAAYSFYGDFNLALLHFQFRPFPRKSLKNMSIVLLITD